MHKQSTPVIVLALVSFVVVASHAAEEVGHGGGGEAGCGYMNNYAKASGQGTYDFKHGGSPGTSAPSGYSDWSLLPNRGAADEGIFNGKVEDWTFHNSCGT